MLPKHGEVKLARFGMATLLVSFILLLDIFTFFELGSDILKNRIPLSKVGEYLFFLTPRWIYELTPVSVLVSVLVDSLEASLRAPLSASTRPLSSITGTMRIGCMEASSSGARLGLK